MKWYFDSQCTKGEVIANLHRDLTNPMSAGPYALTVKGGATASTRRKAYDPRRAELGHMKDVFFD